MMQEMMKGVGNNSTSTISTPTTLTNNKKKNTESSSGQIKLIRCPRCNSNNTKFCYYNNYNLTQPRHFCKSCRRYWTKGGSLRNVPIGGGCRKIKPSKAKAKAKSLLSTEMLSNYVGNNTNYSPVGFLGSGPSPTPVQNSHIFALMKGATHLFPNYISSTTNNTTISSDIDTLGLHSHVYSNGDSTLLGSYPKSNDNLNEFGLLDENQRLKTLGNYYSTYISDDNNERDGNLGSLMTSSSSSARVNLESYGLKNLETSCWSQFS